jgi:hypothetical protein
MAQGKVFARRGAPSLPIANFVRYALCALRSALCAYLNIIFTNTLAKWGKK